jgi:Icc protein
MTAARPLRLLHLTDLHLFADEAGEIYGVRTAETFAATLQHALMTAPGEIDAVLVTGDIAEDGESATYERFRGQMASLDLPVLCLPGNHEDRGAMTRILAEPPLQLCGTRRFPGWRIILLDTHLIGSDEGFLSADELLRLEQELVAAIDEHVLVCLHHQPLPVGSPWLDAYGVVNADAFLSRIDAQGNVRAVLFGHVHQASEQLYKGIRVMSTPSTCAQFTPHTERCVMDLAPPGFRWLELLPDGRIETEVVWLEKLRLAERPPDTRQEA